MDIIDAHVHVFPTICGMAGTVPNLSDKYGRRKNGNRTYQFLPPSFSDTSSSVETLIAYMDWQKVSKAVLMPNPFYGYHNDYFIQSIEKYPDRLRGVALVNILEGRYAAEELQHIYDSTPLFGMKIEPVHSFQCAQGKRLTDKDILPVWECVNENRQPLFIHLSSKENVEDFFELAALFPHITFVLCHMGADACHALERSKEFYDGIIDFCRAKANVYLDTSSVSYYYRSEEYPFPSALAAVAKAYSKVGMEKIFFGSDYPGTLCYCTYEQHINFIAKQSKLNEESLRRILFENSEELFFRGKK